VRSPIFGLIIALTSLVTSAATTSCFGPPLPPARPALPAGTRFVVGEDTAIEETQPRTIEKLDHRRAYLGRPGDVLARGTVVEIVEGDQRPLNPWVPVRVIEGPVAAQGSLRGWIHRDDLAAGGGRAIEVAFDVTITKPSRLCTTVLALSCPFRISPGARARLVRCDVAHAWIELFGDDGRYVGGWVAREQLELTCP
jgi:hypothetical protein